MILWKGITRFRDIDSLIRGSEKDTKELKDADLLVIWSIEIDSLGKDLSIEVLETFDKVLQRVVSAVEKVSLLGYSKIVITTDHDP